MNTYIEDWMLCPFDTGELKLWVRNTPTNHGVVINLANPWLPMWDKSEYSERRWSVAMQIGQLWKLAIVSISYTNGFDTKNQPEEIFKKIVEGQYNELYVAPLADGREMTVVSDWDGMAQSLQIPVRK